MTIREMRRLLDMSQSKFAQYLNIPVINIQHWEQGVASPPKYVVGLIERIIRLEYSKVEVL